MLADDFLGQQRESLELPLKESYVHAFQEIAADPNNELIVAECDGEIIGSLQLTFTPSLSYQGSKRCTVESVRVDSKLRGQGIGREMMLWAIERAKEKGRLKAGPAEIYKTLLIRVRRARVGLAIGPVQDGPVRIRLVSILIRI